jgi:hypothetical protein
MIEATRAMVILVASAVHVPILVRVAVVEGRESE